MSASALAVPKQPSRRIPRITLDGLEGLHETSRRMSNRFYVPGEQRAEKVGELFGAIARRYDLINDVQSFGLHRRWKRRVVELASVRPRDKALDVCCGTGDIAFALAKRGAEVIGLDFSGQMLEVAEARARARKEQSARRRAQGAERGSQPEIELRNPKFQQGDAMRLPFPDESFDIVTVGYGLRNLASWEGGLAEMARVSRPGGRIVTLDFGKPSNRIWRGVYFGYLRIATPIFGLLFSANAAAYSYILESLKHYPAQTGVAEGMRRIGLVNVRIVNPLGGAMGINYGEKAPSSKFQAPEKLPEANTSPGRASGHG